MYLEDILNSNNIDLSVAINSLPDSEQKLYTISIKNNQLNISKTFDVSLKGGDYWGGSFI